MPLKICCNPQIFPRENDFGNVGILLEISAPHSRSFQQSIFAQENRQIEISLLIPEKTVDAIILIP